MEFALRLHVRKRAEPLSTLRSLKLCFSSSSRGIPASTPERLQTNSMRKSFAHEVPSVGTAAPCIGSSTGIRNTQTFFRRSYHGTRKNSFVCSTACCSGRLHWATSAYYSSDSNRRAEVAQGLSGVALGTGLLIEIN